MFNILHNYISLTKMTETRPQLVNPLRRSNVYRSSPSVSQIRYSVPESGDLTIPTENVYVSKDIVRKNSLVLNILGIIFLIMFGYFLYTIYIERKIITSYVQTVQANRGPMPGDLMASKTSVWDL
jgi:hypothetical protein